jgi:aminopeptidase N
MGVLRLCVIGVALVGLNGCASAPGDAAPPLDSPAGVFGNGHAYFHPTRVAPYRFGNSVIRLRFDITRGIVYGDETVTVIPKQSGTRDIPFNTAGIHYSRVTVNGQSAAYTFAHTRELVDIHLGSPAAKGAHLVVDFRYWTQPQSGIYFVRPDKAYPNISPEIWSQGEPTDNRRWFPTWDEPNQKTPSELILTVPRGWTAIANGYLKAHTHTASTDIWDWNAPKPKSTYLISFAAGPLSEYRSSLGKLNIDSYVPPRYAALNSICFKRTKDMIAYFQQIIGVPFPWEKYDQTMAERYEFGGMEDVSATLLTTLALHPAIEDAESSRDVLIAHELAQQWWGDDATMTDWANVWLHEGFATYFDELWTGKSLGKADFEYARYQAQQAYFQETHQYLRPIVDHVYSNALDLFDASSHQRPAEVLHMLRYMFGDQRFFAATRAYLQQYAGKNADTDQFFASIDTSLGTDLSWFKDEWFYRDDYPHYYVTDYYHAAAHALTLEIEQKNFDGKPFRMPIVIEAFFAGRTARIEPLIDRNDQSVTIPNVTSAPDMVLFDPNNNILRQLTFPQPARVLAYQLAEARHVGDREWALQQLAAMTGRTANTRTAVMRSIRRAALHDPFYGVRSDAIAIAASFNDADTVYAALHDPDKRVRLAAEASAANLKGHPEAVIARLDTMCTDLDPNVAASALTSLGALRAPGAYDRLIAALNRPSFQQAVARGALSGLAAYGDARALPVIKARTAYGTQEQERDAAVVALAQLANAVKRPEAALPTLERIVTNDPLDSTRIAATSALQVLDDAAALPYLEHARLSDSQILVRENAENAIMAIRASERK